MLDHFCGSTSFLVEASGGSIRQEGFALEIGRGQGGSIGEAAADTSKGAHGLGYYTKSLTSCTICSRTHESAAIGTRSVVEFCTVSLQALCDCSADVQHLKLGDVRIGRDCLLSWCRA
eukprot:766753-Hanusia_phi.AAC.6